MNIQNPISSCYSAHLIWLGHAVRCSASVLCRSKRVRVGVLILLCGLGTIANADDDVQYNRDIRPILSDACFACHGADESTRKGDLRLDVRDEAIDFGAITEGEPKRAN